jgi:hypothetical protein
MSSNYDIDVVDVSNTYEDVENYTPYIIDTFNNNLEIIDTWKDDADVNLYSTMYNAYTAGEPTVLSEIYGYVFDIR